VEHEVPNLPVRKCDPRKWQEGKEVKDARFSREKEGHSTAFLRKGQGRSLSRDKRKGEKEEGETVGTETIFEGVQGATRLRLEKKKGPYRFRPQKVEIIPAFHRFLQKRKVRTSGHREKKVAGVTSQMEGGNRPGDKRSLSIAKSEKKTLGPGEQRGRCRQWH